MHKVRAVNTVLHLSRNTRLAPAACPCLGRDGTGVRDGLQEEVVLDNLSPRLQDHLIPHGTRNQIERGLEAFMV